METSIDAAISAVAQEHHGIFASHHLRELCVSKAEREWRLGEGRWIEVHLGVYRIAGTPGSWRGDVLAAVWAGGTRAVASHRSNVRSSTSRPSVPASPLSSPWTTPFGGISRPWTGSERCCVGSASGVGRERSFSGDYSPNATRHMRRPRANAS